ncbi:MAG: GIY-YIG nuclease family protein, partial [Actinomyces sp.]|nr:GIY-YIG nuclease family protein [Actinomyces sp.]
MASTGIASYGSTDSEMKPPLKRTMPTRFVQLFRAHLSAALNFVEPITNKRLGKCVGVYAFYDFDGEPIYVGQTTEDFGTRIGRHLRGQRSDTLAYRILDPFEVAEVEFFPADYLLDIHSDKKERSAAFD